ncbi:TetR/AcrR family transcriptional regulator [Streptomyces alboniger]|uniref:TetR/AcrR family transcriptional regulator n=1 Tax=Streptomyces alboniger TaxID=132473 RepID=A0A5J6HP79_STRAD|nr:TetR/AcrR family transcriptional regulator [Streptomyces alboniger]QEV20414.1 TetR/AcrR family transcriptional regulator [Streptomyces alboniger]
MGHREDLLEGAKRCLLEKGFARTTARDIVKESGTNLGSIGYHYGSKDALLAQAYIALIEPLGDTFESSLAGGSPGEGGLERFQEIWGNIIRSVPEARPIWMMTLEVITQGERLAGIRELLIEAQKQGRSGITALFTGIEENEIPADVLESEGRLYTTLLNGLMMQWLFDPASATTAEQLTEGLRRVTRRMREEV